MNLDRKAALEMYKECASLKTGALFRLVGQLVTGSHVKDDIMSSFG
jgi:geranylgeranyldiphosphate transferase